MHLNAAWVVKPVNFALDYEICTHDFTALYLIFSLLYTHRFNAVNILEISGSIRLKCGVSRICTVSTMLSNENEKIGAPSYFLCVESCVCFVNEAKQRLYPYTSL